MLLKRKLTKVKLLRSYIHSVTIGVGVYIVISKSERALQSKIKLLIYKRRHLGASRLLTAQLPQFVYHNVPVKRLNINQNPVADERKKIAETR